MSTRVTRCRSAKALATWVQFLPWPNRPWQKTRRDPRSPSSVVCRLTGPVSQPRGSGSEVEPVEAAVEHAAHAVAHASDRVAETLAQGTDAVAHPPEAAAEQHAHEHPVQGA